MSEERKELLPSADAEVHTEIELTNRRDDRERRGRRKNVLGEFLPLAFDEVEVHNVLVSVVVVVRAGGASGAVDPLLEADDEGSAAVQALSVVDSRAEGRAGFAA